MKTYNKLVRDRIPEIIRADGVEPKIRVLDEAEYKSALLDKLVEEAREGVLANGHDKELVKELADLQEVVDSVIRAFGLSREEIETVKGERRNARGGFEQRLFLESTDR